MSAFQIGKDIANILHRLDHLEAQYAKHGSCKCKESQKGQIASVSPSAQTKPDVIPSSSIEVIRPLSRFESREPYFSPNGDRWLFVSFLFRLQDDQGITRRCSVEVWSAFWATVEQALREGRSSPMGIDGSAQDVWGENEFTGCFGVYNLTQLKGSWITIFPSARDSDGVCCYSLVNWIADDSNTCQRTFTDRLAFLDFKGYGRYGVNFAYTENDGDGSLDFHYRGFVAD